MEFRKNIENIKKPHEGISENVDSIKKNDIENDKKKEFEQEKNELDKSVDSYKAKAIEFFEDYNAMNTELKDNINDFLKSFSELLDNIRSLKQEINEGFKIFENISPELENLEDKENIRKLTADLLSPLNKITGLISKSQEQLDIFDGKKQNEKKDLGNTMIQICTDLKNKANNISERINEIRVKINLHPVEIPPIDIKEPDVNNINNNIEKMIYELEKTKKENKDIQDEAHKRTKDFLNQTR